MKLSLFGLFPYLSSIPKNLSFPYAAHLEIFITWIHFWKEKNHWYNFCHKEFSCINMGCVSPHQWTQTLRDTIHICLTHLSWQWDNYSMCYFFHHLILKYSQICMASIQIFSKANTAHLFLNIEIMSLTQQPWSSPYRPIIFDVTPLLVQQMYISIFMKKLMIISINLLNFKLVQHENDWELWQQYLVLFNF